MVGRADNLRRQNQEGSEITLSQVGNSYEVIK